VLLGAFTEGFNDTTVVLVALLFAVSTIPALLRVFRASEFGAGASQLSAGRVFLAALLSLGLVVLVGVAATIAFVATCLPVGLTSFNLGREESSAGIALAFFLGFLAA